MRFFTLLGAVFLAGTLQAASFDQIVVFGDSLSDNGNVSIATNNQFPGLELRSRRFTDGPNTTPSTSGPQGLWVEQLATRLGVASPQPALAGTGGTNFAFASATTGWNGLFNILTRSTSMG